MCKGLAAALVAAAACACGGSDAPPQAPATGVYTSGTRLRARVLDGGDGAVVFLGWQDTMLGARCTFRRTSAGPWLCVPETPDFYGPLRNFTDPACTDDAVVATTGASGALLQESGCPGAEDTLEIVELEEQAGATRYFHKSAAAGCVETALPDGQHLYRVVPGQTSRYVTARAVTEARGGGLDVEVLLADDGAKQLARTLDHARGAPCDEQFGRCLPLGTSNLSKSDFYGTADCTGENEGSFSCPFVADCPAPPVAYATTPGDDGCSFTVALRTLGPPAAIYQLDAGVCTTVSVGPCYFQTGTGAASLDDYPRLGESELGTGRLRARFRTAPGHDQALAAFGAFHDVERDSLCGPTTFVDGSVRCVPADAPEYNLVFTYFADASCTQAIAQLTGAGPCTPAPAYALEVQSSGPVIVVAAPVRAVHAVGAAWSGVPYLQEAGGCVAGTEATSGWLVGDPVDASGFAALSERTE